MTTHPVFGHLTVQRDLGQAFVRGHLPQVLLFTGEPGVGKQRLALWTAALLLCQKRQATPCGACRPCQLVGELIHPDLYWFVPLPRPKAADSDKQIEEVREALGEVMAERRQNGVYGRPDGLAMHGVASARLLLKIGSLTTVEGGARVIIVGDAERLVPQEASPEAANALLKFLEEPPASTTIILTAPEPTRVLPTIRSRAVPVRLLRLTRAEIDAGLAALAPKVPAAERASRADRAHGSLGRALFLAEDGAGRDVAGDLLLSLKQGGGIRFERSLAQAPWQARGDFSLLLDRLSDALGNAVRAASGATVTARVPDALAGVADPRRLVRGQDHVDRARELAQGNVNPQLVLANLTRELTEALWR